uniref:Uncharacterized protein n=1 Tax=Arundo donax TaxID=35708 RepID=A0A0A9F7B2_ARUDO
MDESVLNGAVSGCSTDDLSCWCTMVLAYFRTLFMLPFLLSHHIAADCSCSFLEIVDSCYQCTVRSHRLHCMSGCCGPLQVQSLMNMPLLFLQPLLSSLYLVDFGLLLQFSQGMQHVAL